LSGAGYPKKDRQEHIDGHLDVLYTFDHGISNWEKSSADPSRSRELSNLCRWVWLELMTADMQVKRKLENLRKPAQPSDA
jgi:hypothetical protein